ncbi:MAG: cobalamin biosynthesis protein [Lachnospiraceae bacterium]|nr:cobalamin biosynthesis protein [Lachnospiraceae bacterium]
MNRIGVFFFSEKGEELANRLAAKLHPSACMLHPKAVDARYAKESSDRIECVRYHSSCKNTLLKTWFANKDAIIFIGAMGIAVRLMAPFIENKETDPAVIVMDEMGRFVIPVLSGHFGGGYRLAQQISECLKGTLVRTAASDVRGLWAIDDYAGAHHLCFRDIHEVQAVAKSIQSEREDNNIRLYLLQERMQGSTFLEETLRGEGAQDEIIPLYVYREVASLEELQKDMERFLSTCRGYREKGIATAFICNQNKEISGLEEHFDCVLYPKNLTVGVGCKKGKSKEAIDAVLKGCFEEYGLSTKRIRSFASVDIKKEEKGLKELALSYKCPFHFYPAEELKKVEGDFTSSGFVENTVGVDNVCERSAVLEALYAVKGFGVEDEDATEYTKLRVRKYAKDGVTIAVAEIGYI